MSVSQLMKWRYEQEDDVFTMFMVAPKAQKKHEGHMSTHILTWRAEAATDALGLGLTDSDVGPVDAYLAWFFCDGHWCLGDGESTRTKCLWGSRGKGENMRTDS